MAERPARRPTTPSRLLVIDASILHAASARQNPTASACRKVLIDILEICHRACATPAIREEWKRHQSVFARGWFTSMYARRKIAPPAVHDRAPIRRAVLSNRTLTPGQVAQIEKDLHLIEAALGADKIILSLDARMRSLLRRVGITALRGVVWADPVEHPAEVQGFLNGSAGPLLAWTVPEVLTGPWSVRMPPPPPYDPSAFPYNTPSATSGAMISTRPPSRAARKKHDRRPVWHATPV